MKKTAIITGVNGQDGSYLAKYLIEKKINVYGIYNNKNFKNINFLKIYKKINLMLNIFIQIPYLFRGYIGYHLMLEQNLRKKQELSLMNLAKK